MAAGKVGQGGTKVLPDWAEGLSVRLSDALIADAEGIQDYYASTERG